MNLQKKKQKYAIDVSLYIPVNGDQQNIRIRTSDRSNPVLLFVHGGPGVCDRSWVMPVQSKYLADRFTMVCWDQRMAGKSYHKEDAGKDMKDIDEVLDKYM